MGVVAVIAVVSEWALSFSSLSMAAAAAFLDFFFRRRSFCRSRLFSFAAWRKEGHEGRIFRKGVKEGN
jgi:hypothetical protein